MLLFDRPMLTSSFIGFVVYRGPAGPPGCPLDHPDRSVGEKDAWSPILAMILTS